MHNLLLCIACSKRDDWQFPGMTMSNVTVMYYPVSLSPLWSQHSGKPFACLPQAHPSPQLLIGISHPNISLFIIHTQHQTEYSNSQLYNNVWCKNMFSDAWKFLELGLFKPHLVRWKQKISLFVSSWFCLWRFFIQQPGHAQPQSASLYTIRLRQTF